MAFPLGGGWTPEEANNHINYRQTKAVYLSLKSFLDKVSDKHVKVLIDNTTAVACITQMGTCHFKEINALVVEIWEWCIQHKIWLTAAHIPRRDNTAADKESRKTRQETEWSLNPSIGMLFLSLT